MPEFTWSNALRSVINGNVSKVMDAVQDANTDAVNNAVTATINDAERMNERVKQRISDNIASWREVSEDSVLKSSMSQIENAIQDAYDNDLGIAELTKRIDEIVDGKGELIARTEVTKAINGGKMIAYKANGANGKQWIHSNTGATGREDHQDFDDQGPIPIAEPWESENGQIMYPGDPDADPAHLCNCNCTFVEAIIEGEEDTTEGELS